MPLTPAQIKDKLVNALDDDKNIIDEKAVEEVLTLLETSTITKEILEQTRLGRDINNVRKTSKNPAIAKRAKNLVKAWKKLIVVPGSPYVSNGQHPIQKISPGFSPASSIGSVTAKNSPALINARQQAIKAVGVRSPITQPKVNQLALPPSKLAQSEAKQKLGTDRKSPMPPMMGHLQRHGNNGVSEDSNISWPGTPPSTVSDSSQDRLIGDRENQDSTSAGNKGYRTIPDKRNFNFDNSQSVHSTESTSKSSNRASDQRDVSKTNIANRKRPRPVEFDNSNDSLLDIPSSKQPHLVSSPSLSTLNRNDVINGAVKKVNLKSPGLNVRDNVTIDSKAMVSSSARYIPNDQSGASVFPNRIHQKHMASRQDSIDSRLSVQSSDSRGFKEKQKVKTTEQLMEDMQRKSATTMDTSVIAQIRTNQIRKESEQQKNVLPSGSKRRGRKKKQDIVLPDTEVVSDVRKLAQTKSEYIERFLQTSVAPIPGEDAYEHSLPHLRQESLDEHQIAMGGCSSTFSQSVYDSGFPYSSRQDKPDSGPSASPPETRDISEVMGSLQSSSTPLESVARLSEEQILARLPPLDYANIDWAMHDYPAPYELPVTAGLVDRLHEENIPGLNGTFDGDGNFKKWHEMLTMDSVYDEPLYILPYVIPDD
ncbi:hypothetical protein Btru_037687 [Bulinus truncatus]|nr:hypothetical protein Btru_037687 [Bulinus truncatus]